MAVRETFFSLLVLDMDRAREFYVRVLDARVLFETPRWTSLQIAGVRVGLFQHPPHEGGPTGLHFVVDDLEDTAQHVREAGGSAEAPTEVAPGVVTVEATDTERNRFTLRRE